MPRPDDLCPRPVRIPEQTTVPVAAPIYLSSVYECRDPEQANALLGGTAAGYVYSRDGHPNADALAARCRELHGAEQAVITGTGMSALSLALLSLVQAGEHIVVSDRLYGRSLTLLHRETARLGIASTLVDTCNLAATAAAIQPTTKLIVVETITNPVLRVSDLTDLAALAHLHNAKLLVDNTFASPVVCRPLEFGADLVMESLTKIMNGHSDVVLGLLCGRAEVWERVTATMSTWGLTAPPFECWLAARGLLTLHLRADRANANAAHVAEALEEQRRHRRLDEVHYPGLSSHPDHALAVKQFAGKFGSMVTFTLRGGTAAAQAFMEKSQIPFCPSLGELSTTLSHPESTSHRGLTPEQRAALGITGGTIRLSVGTESPEFILDAIHRGLA